MLKSYRSRFRGHAPTRSDVNVRCVTVKQLKDASKQTRNNGRLVLNKSQIYTVRLCGRLITIDQNEGHTTFDIDDGTGVLQGRIWSMRMDGLTDLSGSKLDAYYIVVASVSAVGGDILLQTIKATLIEDHNMVTMHMLTAIHEECELNKLSEQQRTDWEKAEKESTILMNTTFNIELDKEAIICLLASERIREMEHGASTKEILESLHMEYNEARNVLGLMLNEGSIYNTVDYNHFKLADNN